MADCRKCKRIDVKCCPTCKHSGGKCRVLHKCGEDCVGYEARIVTNADRIRNMTDEELAEHILTTPAYETCIKFCKNREECCEIMDMDNDIPEEWCKQCLLEWLQKEVE
jgi:hypothetical protein